MESSGRQNVVIVGAGTAGALVSKALQSSLDPSKYDIVVISDRDHYVHYPGTLRMLTAPKEDLQDRVLMDFGPRFNHANHKLVVGSVTSIQEHADKSGGHVMLADGKKVDWSYLVLTPGGKWRDALDLPLTKKDSKAHVASWKSKFEKANDIALVGGGIVGIELAGEIKDFWPNKNVTIVHSSSSLINSSYTQSFRDQTTRRVIDLGVKLVLDDYLDTTATQGEVITRNAKRIVADLIVQTRGFTPNTQFIGTSLGADVLTESGFVKVLPTLQLSERYPRIFAGGDVIEWSEEKQASKAFFQSPVIAKNVVALSQGKQPTAKYNGSIQASLISLGKKQGISFVGILWGLVFGDFFTVAVKSRGLMIPKSI